MNIIVAVDNNWAIGNKGDLLVSIPEDMKYFRKMTTDNVIVFGRKTLAGFPNGMPLPSRVNIIMSKNKDFNIKDGIVIHSKEELFEKLRDYKDKEIYVVGGGKIYEMLLSYCEYAYVTKIDYCYEADTYFPNLDKLDNWEIVGESDEQTYFSLEYYFYKYKNNSPIRV